VPVIGTIQMDILNIHIDGLEYTAMTSLSNAEGVFKECIEASRMCENSLDYQVVPNTHYYTGYRRSGNRRDVQFFIVARRGSGHTISPGYDYDAAKGRTWSSASQGQPEDFFLTRKIDA